MRINTNISAMNTYSKLSSANNAKGKSLEKLSSGLRINKAGDDAAGLAISEKMRGQISGLNQSVSNAQDGISLIQTAEGALSETHSILQRMRELANQSANGTNTVDDRKSIQDEITQLKDEIDRIGNTTEFNTQKLLNGGLQSDGAVVGTNSTNGAKVLTQTAAKLTGGTDFEDVNASGIDTATNKTEVIKIDNAEITINWDKELTEAEKTLIEADYSSTPMTTTQKAEIKSALDRVVNKAIDQHNSDNGASVGHVKFYEAGGKLVAESSKEGQGSQLDFTDVNSVLATYIDPGTLTITGQDTLTTAVAAEELSFEINGVKIQTAALAGGAANSDATSVATDIQTKMRTAIDTYNNNGGLTEGMDGYLDSKQVFVEAKDGRFSVTSASGPVTFNEAEGSTLVKNLGLTGAQTDAAGNGGMTFQIGANKGQSITFGVNDMRTAALKVSSVDVSTQAGASSALTVIDNAISKVSSERSKLGAVQNRLDHTINNLTTTSENLTAAESRIRDVDMAKEMMSFTKNNILSQAATSMLAQANQAPQAVLQLLQ